MSVVLTVLLDAYARRGEVAVVILGALLVLALGLIVGFLTPILALLAMTVQFIGPSGFTLPDTGFAASSLIEALALALLGPGAYSIDALRFGRRVVELPPRDGE